MVLGADVQPVAGWIRASKSTGGDPALLADLGGRLGEQLRAAGALGAGRAEVVPVPTSRLRRAGRGIDHTAMLARGVARAIGGRVRLDLLRHAGGGRQARRRAADRHRAAGATIVGGRRRLPDGCLVVLVDDLRTTGATVVAAERRVRELGARRVVVALVAGRDRQAGDQ